MALSSKLKEVIQIVVRCVPTEKIILIGYIDQNRKARSLFNKDGIPETPFRKANILVITKGGCHKKIVNDQIEQSCKGILMVTCCTISVVEVIAMAQQGSSFVNAVLSSNCIIYEEKHNPVTIPVVPVSPAVIKRNYEEISTWYKIAVSFWEIACSQHKLRDNRMTAFCLHQATEQFLIMLIQAETGYRLGSHNIPKQLRFLRFYNNDMKNVFPPYTKIASESLCILRDAYITSRYKIEFSFADENIQYLMSEVGKLQAIAEKVLWEKLFRMPLPVFLTSDYSLAPPDLKLLLEKF